MRGPLHLWHNLPADAVLVLLVGRVWEVEVHRDVYEGLLRAGKRASRQVSIGDIYEDLEEDTRCEKKVVGESDKRWMQRPAKA